MVWIYLVNRSHLTIRREHLVLFHTSCFLIISSFHYIFGLRRCWIICLYFHCNHFLIQHPSSQSHLQVFYLLNYFLYNINGHLSDTHMPIFYSFLDIEKCLLWRDSNCHQHYLEDDEDLTLEMYIQQMHKLLRITTSESDSS